MEAILYLAGALAAFGALAAITRFSAVHSIIYLVGSLIALALAYFLLGAPFAATLQVIVYAGAIVVLFLFVVMMLNLGHAAEEIEQRWQGAHGWRGPLALAGVFLVELIALVALPIEGTTTVADAREVGKTLFGPYLIAVEVASLLLLAALVSAWHLGREDPS